MTVNGHVATLPADAFRDDGRCCPSCGACVDAPLVVGCHLLVLRAFEVLGKRIARQPRSRWRELAGRPFEVAHTLWPADPRQVDATLRGAFTHVGPLLDVYAPGDAVRAARVVDALEALFADAVDGQWVPSAADVRESLTPVLDGG